MARPGESACLRILLFSLCVAASKCEAESEPGSLEWAVSLRHKKEKVTHMHFFFHDIPQGTDPTAVTVAKAPSTSNSPSLFGLLNVADEPLTMGPEPTSKLIGRGQGFYASVAKDKLSLVMGMYLVFTERKYNGSSLSIFGLNAAWLLEREIPIVGGTGKFRLARGFVVSKLRYRNMITQTISLEFFVTIFHY